KTARAWAEHLGEATQLDAGVAVVAADLPGVPGANCVLEAAVPPGRTPADAAAEVDAHFAAATASGGRPAARFPVTWELSPAAAPAAAAPLRHVEDPHADAALALGGGRAIGRALVLAVGDVGRIADLYVAPAARRQGVGRALLARAIEACGRSAFRHVLLGVR